MSFESTKIFCNVNELNKVVRVTKLNENINFDEDNFDNFEQDELKVVLTNYHVEENENN